MNETKHLQKQLMWLTAEKDNRQKRGVPVPQWIFEGIEELELMLGRLEEDARPGRHLDDASDGGGPAYFPNFIGWYTLGIAIAALTVSVSAFIWR